MKRTTVLLISLLLLFCLSSCATIRKDVTLLQDRANVQAIQIYHSERAYYERDIHVFLEQNEPVAVLESEIFTSFLDNLSNLKFEEEMVFLPIPMDGGCDYEGYIIAVIYSDGSYDIIAEKGLYSYSVGRNGQGWNKYDYSDYCGKTPWVDFIEEYIEK